MSISRACWQRRRCSPLADNIDDQQAAPWGAGKGPGDTVWMGVIDNSGLAVSFIQSLYHEFGSGVVLPESRNCLAEPRGLFQPRPEPPAGAGAR